MKTIKIIGTKLTVQVYSCQLCPGNAKISLNYQSEHSKHHLSGDFLECCKCLKTKPRVDFPAWIQIKAPICFRCRPKRGQHRGKGRPPVREKITLQVGKGGMGSRYAGN